jgi:hypothetical protein
MEYLMTYGWAILIVIIVAAALYALGVFNPATWTGSRPSGFPNIGLPAAGSWQLTSTAGDTQFQLLLANKMSSRINVTGVAVKVGSTDCSNATIGYVPIGAGVGSGSIGLGADFTVRANCGNAVSSNDAGTAYTATVELTYDNLDSGFTGFTETGTLTGTVS